MEAAVAVEAAAVEAADSFVELGSESTVSVSVRTTRCEAAPLGR